MYRTKFTVKIKSPARSHRPPGGAGAVPPRDAFSSLSFFPLAGPRAYTASVPTSPQAVSSHGRSRKYWLPLHGRWH